MEKLLKKRTLLVLFVTLAVVGTYALAGTNVPKKKTDRIAQRMSRYKEMSQKAMSVAAKSETSGQTNSETSPFTSSEIIINEDFSLFSAGTPDSPDGECISDELSWEIPEKYTNKPGYTGLGIYQAGGCCALAKPDYGGVLNTPLGNYSGRIRISFRAKPVGNDQTLFINVMKNGIDYPEYCMPSLTFVRLKKGDDWKDFSFVFENPYANLDGFIQFNAVYSDGIFLDDLKVERDNSFMPVPTGLEAKDFTYNGFTASWLHNDCAEDYMFSLYKQTVVGDSNEEGHETFDNLTSTDGVIDQSSIPDRWTITCKHTLADKGHENSQALCLCSNDDIVELPSNGGAFTKLSFYFRHVSHNDCPVIILEGKKNGVWEEIWYNEFEYWEPEESAVKDLNELENRLPQYYNFTGQYTAIRFRCEDFEEGDTIALDDIHYEMLPATEYVNVIDRQVITDNFIKLDNLEADEEYYFSVIARNAEGTESEPSILTHAFGVSAPNVLSPTDISENGYKANWESAPKATGYEVCNYSIFTASAPINDHTVLFDDFSKITEGDDSTAIELPGQGTIRLDEYTSDSDWYGTGVLISKGKLGCTDGYNELYTPELTLNHDKGVFTVTMTVSVNVGEAGGDIFYVQSNNQDFQEIFNTADTRTLKFIFTDGIENQRLMFYTYYGTPFLIDDISVTQNIESGDKVVKYLSSKMVSSDDNSCVFESLENKPGFTYGYNIISKYETISDVCYSDRSDMMEVTLLSTSIDSNKTNYDLAKVWTSTGFLHVLLSDNSAISIYDTCGRMLKNCIGKSGENTFRIGSKGVYLVKISDKTYKVTVK
ncbi:hypothetical protein [Xylanibacter rarus]|uniref:hypothetical protein n=1 Tax=Xylanibacter rarus TaxID=1676614 RepID=UPI003AB95E0C